ncbi:response regulator [Paenibacillus athensensis]|uniref:Response regulatory domain-containing protein n=1 Tax=Paenibacillus athensensis TaxID=1967502 RepID=A0A4Y8PY68_9BACL|nr:response regulator [Paenibacillus athensensis]MCD1259673.1 response regulator [Paenibacillus athensensis]
MAVLAHDPIQEATLQAAERVQVFYEKGVPCGMILAPCAAVNQTVLEQMQIYMNGFAPDLKLHGFYLEPSGFLGIVLAGQKLINAHYASLVLKEFLEQQALLEGQVVVASFPESGKWTEQALSHMLHMTQQGKGESRDIHLFMHHGAQQAITSILIADPDEVSREFVKLRLEMNGYQVEEAKDGSEALEKFDKTMPQLVITELNLPVLDGYQLIDKIKRDYGGEGQVIVLTDKQLPKSMDRAFELGAADYVTKPFSMSELEWRIKKLGSRLG